MKRSFVNLDTVSVPHDIEVVEWLAVAACRRAPTFDFGGRALLRADGVGGPGREVLADVACGGSIEFSLVLEHCEAEVVV